jgi:hypothetical protein
MLILKLNTTKFISAHLRIWTNSATQNSCYYKEYSILLIICTNEEERCTNNLKTWLIQGLFCMFCGSFYNALSSYTTQVQMVGWLIWDKLERIWKQQDMTKLKDYPGSWLEGLRKTTRNSFSITGVLAEIKIEHFPNTSLECYHLLTCWNFLRPWRWRRYIPPKRRLHLNTLHGVTSQKMILFII